MLKIPDN